MDQKYLLDLINEAQNRGGGMILNYDNSPAMVVLTVDKYNQLISNSKFSSFATPLRQGYGGQAASEDLRQMTNTEMEFQASVTIENQKKDKKILVTGGAGYIGAHAARELLKAGYEVVVLDNLSTGRRENVPGGAAFVEGDLGDVNFLRDIFAAQKFYAVMHFTASIEVEESVRHPQKYFDNNVANTQKLLSVMAEAEVKNIIFSSTAAVYGEQSTVPIAENARLQPNNPYGYTKLLCERVLKYYANYLDFRVIVFRYFNACGCDFDGGILPTHESHLMPIVMQTALGKRPAIKVNGTDYNTHDGSAVRDYVHVLDIARAHVLGLDFFDKNEGYKLYNIGTGRGCSVLEIINKASEVLNKIIPMEMGPRRPGDSEATVADNRKIREELGFELQHSDLDTIITTSWTMMQKTG